MKMKHRFTPLTKAAMLLFGMAIISFAQSSYAQSRTNYFEKKGATVDEPVLLLTLKDRLLGRGCSTSECHCQEHGVDG